MADQLMKAVGPSTAGGGVNPKLQLDEDIVDDAPFGVAPPLPDPTPPIQPPPPPTAPGVGRTQMPYDPTGRRANVFIGTDMQRSQPYQPYGMQNQWMPMMPYQPTQHSPWQDSSQFMQPPMPAAPWSQAQASPYPTQAPTWGTNAIGSMGGNVGERAGWSPWGPSPVGNLVGQMFGQANGPGYGPPIMWPSQYPDDGRAIDGGPLPPPQQIQPPGEFDWNQSTAQYPDWAAEDTPYNPPWLAPWYGQSAL